MVNLEEDEPQNYRAILEHCNNEKMDLTENARDTLRIYNFLDEKNNIKKTVKRVIQEGIKKDEYGKIAFFYPFKK